jgi:hypothetical protein
MKLCYHSLSRSQHDLIAGLMAARIATIAASTGAR